MNRRHFASLALALVSFASTAFADAFPSGSPAFETDYKKTLKKATKDAKPSIVVFSASWCGPCQTNKKSVYPNSAVKPYHDKFVWAYLDTDEAANAKVSEKYNVSGIPHIEFLDKNGKSLGNLVGATTPADFSKKLDEILKTAGASATAAAAKTGDLNDAIAKDLAEKAAKKKAAAKKP
jgi:thiol:disulfide interchange protein